MLFKPMMTDVFHQFKQENHQHKKKGFILYLNQTKTSPQHETKHSKKEKRTKQQSQKLAYPMNYQQNKEDVQHY